jgi:hypothetical protein
MNEYKATRTTEGCVVTVNGKPLSPRHDLSNHSPDGFEWGYEGSGPSQLALAILAYELQDDKEAASLYQEFKRKTLANFQAETWTLDSIRISAILEVMKNRVAA